MKKQHNHEKQLAEKGYNALVYSVEQLGGLFSIEYFLDVNSDIDYKAFIFDDSIVMIQSA